MNINLLVTSDSTYVPMVATLITSIHQFLPDEYILNVYWMHVDNNKNHQEQLIDYCAKSLPKARLIIRTFESLPNHMQNQVGSLIRDNNSSWGPALCFTAPFILPLLLPEAEKRAIFIDADVIALGDISELAGISLDGMPAGCVRAPLKFFHKRLGLDKYCNSGMIAIDVETWKNENISDKAIDYLRKISGSWGDHFPDQDALNVTLSDSMGRPKWKELHPKWNACSPLYTKSRLRLLYGRIPIGEVKLLHYCGAKPWERVPSTLLGRIARKKGFKFGSTKPAHPHGKLFYDVLDSIPFAAPGQK